VNIEEAVVYGTLKLQRLQSPQKESETLLWNLLNRDRLYLILNRSEILSADIKERYLQQLDRRAEGEPLEYITNRVSFYSNQFFIDRGALIPRPESELLIDEVLKVAKDGDRVLEIGVGSGAVSITLSQKLPNSKVVGVDISRKALQIAEINRAEKGVENLTLLESDLFSSVEDRVFDVIVSNPPYISEKVREDLQVELSFEPDLALFGGDSGDEILKNIIEQFFQREEKYLICEMGYDQRESIRSYVADRGKLDFYRDLSGLYRGFRLCK
jgi:release factor glutamine methyltransferase